MKLLTQKELENYLPFRYKTIRNKVSNGSLEIKSVKLGGRRVFLESDVLEFVANLFQQPAEKVKKGRGRPRKNVAGGVL